MKTQLSLAEAQTLSARLEKHPELRHRVERLLDLCEDAAGDLRKADEAEQRVIAEMRALGQEVLEDWARGQVAIRAITEAHARGCATYRQGDPVWPSERGASTVVAEIDGGMVPLVQSGPQQRDRRQGKQLLWKEAKLCLAHEHGSATPVYGGTLLGGVDEAGRQLLACTVAVGLGKNTHVHAVGDGAPWIADQVDEQFGTQGSYLVDFFHVCDYLGAAPKVCAPQDPSAWLERQKANLKASRSAIVLGDLLGAIEPPTVPDEEAPVRACHRYLTNRRAQLDYAGAIAADLPIGSGEIESAHRYVVRQRLKRPGAWWTPENAEAMLALRFVRANGQWSQYWSNDRKQAA